MKISVVLPTFNRSPAIVRAVDSVLAQTRQADEIIVVDDGSSDNTVQQLQSRYREKITLIVQANKGVSAARNVGIGVASGDWVALLDSDDEWLPAKLNAQQLAIEQTPDTVLCHTDEIWVRNGKRVNPMKKHRKYGGQIFSYCLPLCVISPSSVLMKKSLWSDLGGFDESLPACEDYDLWLRICAENPVLFVDSPLLIKYGGHNDQLSRKYTAMDQFRVRSLDKLLDNGSLSDEQRQMTIATLLQKSRILLTGAVKHENQPLASYCNSLLAKYEDGIPVDTSRQSQ